LRSRVHLRQQVDHVERCGDDWPRGQRPRRGKRYSDAKPVAATPVKPVAGSNTRSKQRRIVALRGEVRHDNGELRLWCGIEPRSGPASRATEFVRCVGAGAVRHGGGRRVTRDDLDVAATRADRVEPALLSWRERVETAHRERCRRQPRPSPATASPSIRRPSLVAAAAAGSSSSSAQNASCSGCLRRLERVVRNQVLVEASPRAMRAPREPGR
jgi:hypothetical protein